MNSRNLSFRYISFQETKTLSGAVTPQRQSQFTPKMKANAEPRLLSSLVWIDQYNECEGLTSFMEFTWGVFYCTHIDQPILSNIDWFDRAEKSFHRLPRVRSSFMRLNDFFYACRLKLPEFLLFGWSNFRPMAYRVEGVVAWDPKDTVMNDRIG